MDAETLTFLFWLSAAAIFVLAGTYRRWLGRVWLGMAVVLTVRILLSNRFRNGRIGCAPALKGCLVVLAVVVTGCAGTERVLAPSAAGPAALCERLFAEVDGAVARAGVGDGGGAPVDGFPYLRVDRFLASFRGEPVSREARVWWIGRMRLLDREARAAELANLPYDSRRRLRKEHRQPGDLAAALERCGDLLMRRDLADAGIFARLRAVARVPDDYQTWKRVIGLYPLMSLPFYKGVLSYHAETRATFEEPLSALPRAGRLLSYEPDAESMRGGSRGLPGSYAPVLARARNNPLGVPVPEGDDLTRLLRAYAPILEVQEADRNDRVGTPEISRSGTVQVNTSRSRVFARIAHARYQGEPLLQLVYSAWFPARPMRSGVDLLGGRLDGITWRVTLAPDGEPLLYDSMHNCGCYHMFFPTAHVRLRSRGLRGEEPPLVPVRLGERGAGERIVLRIASRTHYIEDVRYDSLSEDLERRRYHLGNANDLRSIGRPGGGRRSLFRPDGIVPGTERGERYLFWPMGVREPGAMRQWGRHATAFVGRRHFDDPDLIERYFEIR